MLLPGMRHPVTIMEVRKFGDGTNAVPVRKVIFLMLGGQVRCWALNNGSISAATIESAVESLPRGTIPGAHDISSWIEPTELKKQ